MVKNASVCILESGAFSSLTAMLIAPSQCGPDETVVGFRPLYGGPAPLMGE